MFEPVDYWYDAQMRRFLEQMVRAFSGFTFMTGVRNGEAPQQRVVPCKVANVNRSVSHILRNASENIMLSVPQITIAQTGLSHRREDVQNPGFVGTVQVTERGIVDGKYTSDIGNRYTIQRIMPIPFQMNVQIDIWTSNLDQKHQLAEQILTVICPSFDIQNSENPLDWTSLTTAYLEDITWTSRSIPIGTETEIEIMTITMRIPMYLSAPVSVRKQTRIETVVTNVNEATRDANGILISASPMTQVVTTPGKHWAKVEGGVVTLLGSKDNAIDPEQEPYNWRDLLVQYGTLRPAQSQIRLYLSDNIEGQFVTGTVQFDSTDNTKLLWQVDVDTLPANTLTALDAVIDPLRSSPLSMLPNLNDGARYLLVNDVGPSQAWGPLTARENDIIEMVAGKWQVVFEATTVTTEQFALNTLTTQQLHWTGSAWEMAIDRNYAPGFWRLFL